MRHKESFQELLDKRLPSKDHPCYALWRENALNAVNRGRAIIRLMASDGFHLENKQVLDVGCGSCGIYVAFVQHGAEAVGLDISRDTLKVGKARILENGLEVNLVVASAQNIPFRNCSFDMVVCSDVIEHTKNPADCARQVSSVLKERGILYITAPNLLSLVNFFSDPHFRLPFISLLPPSVGRKIQQRTKRGNEEIKMFSIWGLMELFRKLGFRMFIADDIRIKRRIVDPRLVQSRMYRLLLSLMKCFRAERLVLWTIRIFWNRGFVFVGIKGKSLKS